MGKAMKRAAIYLRYRRKTKPRPTKSTSYARRQSGPVGRWRRSTRITASAALRAAMEDRRSMHCAGDATKRQFDVVMAWNVDRLGRSLKDLVAFLSELHALGIDLFLHQQGLDTTTPAGKAMFQMLGVFAEFERSIIQERVRAGLQRAKREGKRLGRPPIADKLAERIRTALAGGMSVRKTAAKFAPYSVSPTLSRAPTTQASPARPRQISGPARPGQIKWSGPAASIGWNASRPGVSERPLGGRARENRKFIQAPSPEIWSETISGGEEVLAGKWGGLFMGYLLGKIFGSVIAIISYCAGGWMQQSTVPRCAILSVGSTGGIGRCTVANSSRSLAARR